jgi:hypothetical protein
LILTPKNWGEFQHYKDREPSWIKLHKSLLTNYEFICLPIASKALAPMLWLLASEYKDGIIDASLDKIAFRLSMKRGELAEALTPLLESGFFDASEPLAERKQEAIPEKEVQVEDIEKSKSEKRAREDDWPKDFREQFWNTYPNKVGKAAAISKLEATRKRGVEWPLLMGGLRTYILTKPKDRQWCNPATWLTQDRWLDQPADANPAAPSLSADKISLDEAVSLFAKVGRWSRHSPVNDLSQVPVELLAKHGLLPDGRKISASQGHHMNASPRGIRGKPVKVEFRDLGTPTAERILKSGGDITRSATTSRERGSIDSAKLRLTECASGTLSAATNMRR